MRTCSSQPGLPHIFCACLSNHVEWILIYPGGIPLLHPFLSLWWISGAKHVHGLLSRNCNLTISPLPLSKLKENQRNVHRESLPLSHPPSRACFAAAQKMGNSPPGKKNEKNSSHTPSLAGPLCCNGEEGQQPSRQRRKRKKFIPHTLPCRPASPRWRRRATDAPHSPQTPPPHQHPHPWHNIPPVHSHTLLAHSQTLPVLSSHMLPVHSHSWLVGVRQQQPREQHSHSNSRRYSSRCQRVGGVLLAVVGAV